MYYDKRFEPQVETKPDPVADVLLAAADYIEQHGWCQFYTRDDQGAVCGFGAIFNCSNPPIGGHTLLAVDRMQRRLGMSISAWNDMPGRTKDEVVAALRAASR